MSTWLRLWTVSIYIFSLFKVISGNTEAVFQRKPGKYLGNYVIQSLKQESEIDCSMSCLNEPDCVSANFKVNGTDLNLCELNFKTLEEITEEAQIDAEYVYLEVSTRVWTCNSIYF